MADRLKPGLQRAGTPTRSLLIVHQPQERLFQCLATVIHFGNADTGPAQCIHRAIDFRLAVDAHADGPRTAALVLELEWLYLALRHHGADGLLFAAKRKKQFAVRSLREFFDGAFPND